MAAAETRAPDATKALAGREASMDDKRADTGWLRRRCRLGAKPDDLTVGRVGRDPRRDAPEARVRAASPPFHPRQTPAKGYRAPERRGQ